MEVARRMRRRPEGGVIFKYLPLTPAPSVTLDPIVGARLARTSVTLDPIGGGYEIRSKPLSLLNKLQKIAVICFQHG